MSDRFDDDHLDYGLGSLFDEVDEFEKRVHNLEKILKKNKEVTESKKNLKYSI